MSGAARTAPGGPVTPAGRGRPEGAPIRPRLVATDLDGTLVGPDRVLSPRTLRVLTALPAAGVHVIAVTARPPRALAGIRALGATAICMNGAAVWDLAEDRPLELHLMADDVLADLAADLRAALPGARLAVETPTGLRVEHGFVAREWPHTDGPAADRLEDLLDGTSGKLLVRSQEVPAADVVPTVRAALAGRGELGDSGAVGLGEVTAPGVTKAAALERWAAGLGVGAAEVWAFGDMPNDLPMLRWAGRAFAIAGGHPDVLAVADEVCRPPAEDGVAARLEALLG